MGGRLGVVKTVVHRLMYDRKERCEGENVDNLIESDRE